MNFRNMRRTEMADERQLFHADQELYSENCVPKCHIPIKFGIIAL